MSGERFTKSEAESLASRADTQWKGAKYSVDGVIGVPRRRAKYKQVDRLPLDENGNIIGCDIKCVK